MTKTKFPLGMPKLSEDATRRRNLITDRVQDAGHVVWLQLGRIKFWSWDRMSVGGAGPILVCGGGIPEILGGSVCPWGHNLGLVSLPYYWWTKVQLPSSESERQGSTITSCCLYEMVGYSARPFLGLLERF